MSRLFLDIYYLPFRGTGQCGCRGNLPKEAGYMEIASPVRCGTKSLEFGNEICEIK